MYSPNLLHTYHIIALISQIPKNLQNYFLRSRGVASKVLANLKCDFNITLKTWRSESYELVVQ